MKLRTFFISTILLGTFTLGAFVRCGKQLGSATLTKLNSDQFTNSVDKELTGFHTLFAPEKLYLHTDKPFYLPGEDLWFSGYLLPVGQTPTQQLSDIVYVELLNPRGAQIEKQTLYVNQGKIKGSFSLGIGAEGGLYKIKAYTNWMQKYDTKAVFEKQIQVQKVVPPQLLLKLDFKREAYGLGDEIEATLEARTLKDQPIALQKLACVVDLAGKKYQQIEATTDGKGKASIKFTLPKKLENNDGLLTVTIKSEGVSESVSRALPIVLDNIALDFFPEGGNWVAAIEGKMAFKAVNEFGEPADIEGVVLDDRGREVQSFKSFHQGMGAFVMTPAKGKKYKVRLTKPAGIDKTYPLPKAQTNKHTLGVKILDKNRLGIHFYNPKKDTLYLTIQSGGKIYYSQKMLAGVGLCRENVSVTDYPIGITKISLMNAQKKPLCERLVFVNPHKQLKVAIKTRQKSYQPRQKVELDILTTNENGKPVAANLSVAVVDDKILTLADDKQDNLLSYMLLSGELEGKIHEPNFYFQPNEPKAADALDYVMMIHGWRRYEWASYGSVLQATQKEQAGVIKGQVTQKGSNRPEQAEVVLYELGTKTRKLKTKTDDKGFFAFDGINPEASVQLFAWSTTKTQKSYTIRLKNNYRKAYRSSLFAYYFSNDDNYKLDSVASFYSSSDNQKAGEGDFEEMIEIPITEVAPPPPSPSKMPVTVSQDELKVSSLDLIKKVDMRELLEMEDMVKLPPDLSPIYNVDGQEYRRIDEVTYLHPASIASLELKGATSSQEKIHITTNSRARSSKTMGHSYLRKLSFSQSTVFEPIKYTTKDQNPAKRTDFRNTIYWNPEVVTDKNGKATLSFWNSDALTTFRIIVEGVGNKGLLGRAEQTYFTKLPFELTAKLPPYFSVNDAVKLPVYLTNNTSKTITGKLQVSAPKGFKISALPPQLSIAPQTTQTIYVEGKVTQAVSRKDSARLEVYFKSKAYNESYSQPVEVFAQGFPIQESFSGTALNNRLQVKIPKLIEGTLQAKLVAYPNILGDLVDGIASVLQRPHGCFEQVSASTYPNILALQFLEKTNTARPEFRAKALDYIADGYRKLIAYETSQHGFEWYGNPPPHEGLSAFGLMEFLEMKKVYNGVDGAMIERTKQWLLSRRDGKGGFEQNSGKYGFSGASREVNNAYVTYALSEAGVKNIEREYNSIYQEAQTSQDAYRMALVTLTAFNLGKTSQAKQLLEKLRSQVATHKSGKLKANHSIVRSGGISLQVETTALIALAEMRLPKPSTTRIKPLLDYIIAQRSEGYFGSTQGTVLALQVLTRFATLQAGQASKGKLLVYKGTKQIASLSYTTSQTKKIVIEGLEKYLSEGSQEITVRFEKENQIIPFTLDLKYYTPTPKANPACKLDLTTELSQTTTKEGKTVRLTTTIRNKQSEGLPSTIALIGIPAGLSPQPWQLKALQEQGKIAFYEIKRSHVVFYFRELAPSASLTIPLDLKADIPGTYRAPASCAYLYYTSEHKDWEKGVSCEIQTAKEEKLE